MEKNNIVLIGMPGVGKSTLGVILAKVKGYKFIDADLLIQERENKLLSEIIKEKGIDGFIKIEDSVNSSINTENTVIATGGSVIYGDNAMKNLKDIGTVVYLKQDLNHIKRRIKNIQGRGVVLRDHQTFEEMFDERVKLYEKYADITVEQGNMKIEDTLKKLLNELN